MEKDINTQTDAVINELKSRGYDAVPNIVIKNGVQKHGIAIRYKGSNCAPNIYIDEMLASKKSVSEIVDEILHISESNKVPEINAEEYFTPEYLESHVYMTLQRKSGDDFITKAVGFDEDLEIVMRVAVSGPFGPSSFKMNEATLNMSGISETILWNWAVENTFKESVIYTLKDVYRKIYNVEPDLPDMPFWVVTNKELYQGAASILNERLLKEFSEKTGIHEFKVVPSSIHEMILIPVLELDMSDSVMEEMVKEVNLTMVPPEEVLSDKVYTIKV